jgi:cytochrome c oxidase subunit 2
MEDPEIVPMPFKRVAGPPALLLALAGIGGCRGVQSALDPVGPAAESIASIWWAMLIGATAVWLLVVILLWLALRRREHALPRPEHPLRFIVGGGIVLPLIALTALLI